MARFQSASFRLHTLDLNGALPLDVGGMIRTSLRTNAQTISDDSGSLYDESMSMLSELIDGELQFKSLDAILQNIGLAGYCIKSDASHPGAVIYGRILGDCKSPPSSTENIRYTIGDGLLAMGQISARRGADATITLRLIPITDGTNAPIAWAYSGITLPLTSTLSKNLFTLGACSVGDILLDDFDSLDLQFGLQYSTQTPMMGSIWSDSIAVRKVQPIAVFTGFDPRILDDTRIPLLGRQAMHADSMIQFKKRLNYSTFVDDAALEHISMTINGMAIVTDIFQGSGNAEATHAIVVKGVYDGDNDVIPIVIDPTSIYDPAAGI